MIATDACVHPYPAGNSSFRRMAYDAGEMGFDSIVAIGGEAELVRNVRVVAGLLVSAPTVKEVISQVRKRPAPAEIILVNAGDNAFNRGLLNVRGIHVIRHMHKTPRNSFDHVIARIAGEKGIAIDIDLQPLIHQRGPARQKAIMRYQDIIRLHARYAFPLTVSSNACSVLDQRSVRDFISLCSLLDMSDEMVKDALGTIGTLLAPPRAVEVVL